jgi:hypothetical protein
VRCVYPILILVVTTWPLRLNTLIAFHRFVNCLIFNICLVDCSHWFCLVAVVRFVAHFQCGFSASVEHNLIPRIQTTLGVKCMLRVDFDVVSICMVAGISLTYSLFNVSSSIVFNRLFYNLVVRLNITFLPHLITLVYFLIYYLNHKMII